MRRHTLLPLLLCATALRAQPTGFSDPRRAEKLAAAFADVDRVFRESAERQHVPGAAWGIVVDGKLAHVGVTGYRDVAAKAPVDTNTVFRIASMTKSFTAMSILKLRDEGKLALDDPAERWVPELRGLKYPTSDAPKITIRHLLSHSTGFPEDNPWGDQQLSLTDAQFAALLARGIPFSNAPGVAYEYSNLAFMILGRVVTRASGVPYRDYVAANILKPLGMTSSTLSPTAVSPSRLAQGYRWEDERWKLEPQLPDGAGGSMGGMLTSLHDLGTYVGALLGAWPPRDGPETGPVRRASLREMQEMQRPNALGPRRTVSGATQLAYSGYGFGLGISATCDFAHVVAHSGGLPGFGSLMRWLPEYGVGVIAFGNKTYTSWGAPADEAIAVLAKTGALAPRAPRPSPALAERRAQVSRLVLGWSDALADSVAAMNLFLDRSRDRRRAEIATLLGQVGPCRTGDSFEVVENALRGAWRLPCDRGALRVSITLAPTMPPTVQFLDVSAVPAAEEPRRNLCAP